MQVDVQSYLDLLEQTHKLAFFDLEATGLKGDYNSLLVGSLKPYGKKPFSFCVVTPGNDRSLVCQVRDALESYPCWATYYGKGFDVPILQSRLLANNCGRLHTENHHHIDMYFSLKAKLLTARKSQAHLLRWLGTEEKKMDMSPEEWNRVLANPTSAMDKMRRRCESDVEGLEALYRRTRHLLRDIKRG